MSQELCELSFESTDDLIATMREKAAEVGCDGIVILEEADEEELTLDEDAEPEVLEGLRGSCIVYVEGPSPSAASAP